MPRQRNALDRCSAAFVKDRIELAFDADDSVADIAVMLEIYLRVLADGRHEPIDRGDHPLADLEHDAAEDVGQKAAEAVARDQLEQRV